ncbi:malate dehydrogenase, mitochondrial-like isoform X2 [Maniola jurtina]|uniref:malate dehydrogenase, mitochondrial-like isoform X2 n=1 Tax=Maniola jurtina TaxID=191418 RepID=UPI001E689AE0|nr:malate dehydrogenase, mitochondrial-like isoform X2 [Maniola jurtina]
MHSSKAFSLTNGLWDNVLNSSRMLGNNGVNRRQYTKQAKDSVCIFSLSRSLVNNSVNKRGYAKKPSDDCRKACVDIPPEVDPVCNQPNERKTKKKQGILHKIKLKIVEGGTNFGTPFRSLQRKDKVCKEVVVSEPKALPDPVPQPTPLPPPRPAVQVSVLGADTSLGQYVALLLKQCPCIKKLRLYEATSNSECSRDLCQVVQDLQHIDTNCVVQAFSCASCELERCLQNSDIVLLLESGSVSMDMPIVNRFNVQAPIVKAYADAIAKECPNAFIIVCTTPIECMVPLIAETLKETGWYNPRKLLGSLAVPEMRASTLAARALCLEPYYVHVPCVCGTEGPTLVPLFSKALQYFDFSEHNAEMMTQTVRCAASAVARADGNCCKAAELSEAHAIAGLVTRVAWALLCKDVPRISGFVETDPAQVVSPARFIANAVEITGSGITKSLGLPKMSDAEVKQVDDALNKLYFTQQMVNDWYCKYCSSTKKLDACQTHFFNPKASQRFEDCAYAAL